MVDPCATSVHSDVRFSDARHHCNYLGQFLFAKDFGFRVHAVLRSTQRIRLIDVVVNQHNFLEDES
jgi:hypothetical protein